MEVKSGNIEILRGRQEEDEYVRYSVYLHYWYKSTNTDAEGASTSGITNCSRMWKSRAWIQRTSTQVLLLSLFDLLVQKCKF